MFDDGHFAENFARTERGKNAARAGIDAAENFHQSALDEIKAVTGIALAENFVAGGQVPFLRDEPQRLEFGAVQTAEERDRFEGDHKPTLPQNSRASSPDAAIKSGVYEDSISLLTNRRKIVTFPYSGSLSLIHI